METVTTAKNLAVNSGLTNTADLVNVFLYTKVIIKLLRVAELGILVDSVGPSSNAVNLEH